MSENTQIFICRFCLCRCENPISMLLDTEFADKVNDVFYKLNLEVKLLKIYFKRNFKRKIKLSSQISSENGLPVVVCDFCYNTIEQFHSFFRAVLENQEKLKMELQELLQEQETGEVKLEFEENDDDEEWHVMNESDVEENFSSEVGNFIEKSDLSSMKKREKPPRTKRFTLPNHVVQKYKSGAPLDADLDEKLSKNQNKLYICDHCPNFHTISKARMVCHVRECRNLSFKRRLSLKMSHEMLMISCPKCPSDALKMKNDEILQLHLQEHADVEELDRNRVLRGFPPLIPCPKCERRLRTDADFISHMQKHEIDDLMTCELCGRTTVKSNLRSHLRNHFKKIVCEFCSKVFKNQTNLKRHILAKHTNSELFVCDRCNMRIKRENKFKEHLSVCRGPDTVWPCIHCGETFQSNSHRHYHVKKFHIGYKCKMCAIEVRSVTQLKHHYTSDAHKLKSAEKRERLAQNRLLKSTKQETGQGVSIQLKRR